MVHRLFTKGSFEFVHRFVDSKGAVTLNKIPGVTNQLHGMLGFINGVDLHNRNKDKTLSAKAKRLRDQSSLTDKESMYRRFLLFKEFYAASAPVIICEGKTDNIYILHAIRSLATTHPQLAMAKTDGTIKLNVRIYKYSGTSTGRILGINGGSTDLGRLMVVYKSEIARFTAPGNQHAVVILIDNDSGAIPIYKIVKELTGTKPGGTEMFVHVTGNLYLVATPLKLGLAQSSIEDFFDDNIKSTVIGGKKFDASNDFDTATHYGKTTFARKVVEPNANKIDFSEFNAILSNVESAINAHAKKYPVVSQTP